MNYKTTLTTITLFIFTLIMFYLNGIEGILEFFLSLFTYTIIFYFFHTIWAKFRKKPIIDSSEFIKYFLYRVSILLSFFTILIGGLAYLSNAIYPAPMPEYTISNGTKIVKFQAMSHIATQEFYNQIKNNLIQFKKEGGVYFYEGVRPGTKENSEKFNQAIGLKFDKNLYKNFSKLYGVVNQQNENFLGLINNLDFNVDLNLNQIMSLYQKKLDKNNNVKQNTNTIPLDVNKEIINTLSKLNNRELKVLIYINQAILNFLISNQNTQDFLTQKFGNKELFDVILGERNKIIANTIINSKYKKIYTTYGLLHFKGVLKLLQKNNSKWKIIETKYLYPIKN